MRRNGVDNVYHYLDDFLVLGAPGTNECAEALSILLGLTGWLGLPVAEEKVEGPATVLIYSHPSSYPHFCVKVTSRLTLMYIHVICCTP